jgi:hypothetical protein
MCEPSNPLDKMLTILYTCSVRLATGHIRTSYGKRVCNYNSKCLVVGGLFSKGLASPNYTFAGGCP